jgi:signal transduction histidine kinase
MPQRRRSVQIVGVSTDTSEQASEEARSVLWADVLAKAQEEERIRISRELHDDICQRLALLGVELERLRDSPDLADSRLQLEAERLAQFTVEIGSSVQALSHELHSSKLEILGTSAAMKSFCEFARQHEVKIAFSSTHLKGCPRRLPLFISHSSGSAA